MNNKKLVGILTFMAFGSGCFTACGQDSLFLHRAISSLEQQPVQEKVYLHLDKPSYAFGDTIWYKAYTVLGQKHQPSALSGVLYVELLSPKDSLVTRQTIPLVSGIGWSDIPLPFNLKPGTYRIRTYTRWMRNFGPGAFDEQRLVIGGVEPVAMKTAEKIDVQFFPEGGELVEGVRSRVAVKAVGVNGLGKDIKGTIEDSSGNVVADFDSQHLGMGVFALIPEAGKGYRARIDIPGETSFKVDLPQAKALGYTLSINNSEKDSIYVKVSVNEKTLAVDKDKVFNIIAQSNGKVYYTTRGKLEGTVYTALIAKSRFPEGIAQFTLFSQSGQPLAERIAFIENKAGEINLSIGSNTSNSTCSTRDKVTLNITARDSTKPITGSFSVAVINETRVSPDENSEGTILNNLLLTSELKGYIEQPNYYFINPGDKTRSDLDLLMLTQGYRRYEWKQILNPDTTRTTMYKPERSQELSGTITTPGGKPIPNGKVTLAATKQGIFRDTTTDVNGKFIFTGLNITDTATVVINARKANNGSNVKIVPERPEYPKVTPVEAEEPVAADTVKARQQYADYQKEQKDYQFKGGKMLKTVTIKETKRPEQPRLQFSSNLNGPGHADQVIMWNQLGDGCINLTDCLEGKVLGVIFKEGKAFSTRRFSKMRIIVDGVTLDANASLNDVNATDIYSIEVLRSGAYLSIYGTEAPAGALVITMKHGNEGTAYFTQTVSDGIITFPFPGFYKAKAFYNPKYQPKADERLNTRTTIYWNPNILTDKDGKATIAYFNNDTKGTYRVVVEGIDDDGNLGRAVYKYEVK